MTKENLNRIIESDPYHKVRENPSLSDLRLYLREVDFHCSLCDKELQSRFSQEIPENDVEFIIETWFN